jgi:hypothetical protein
VRSGDYSGGGIAHSLGGLDGVGNYINDYSGIATGGRSGNLAVTFLGSYSGTISVSNVTSSGATLNYHVSNISDLASATHLPFYGEIYNACGCGDAWEAFVNSIPGDSGPLSPIRQDFYWSENVTF